jgi:hypothetical protein
MDPWIKLGFSAFTLGLEANQVIAARLLRLASGRSAHRELKLMLSEKLVALNAAGRLAVGATARGDSLPATAERVIASYRKRVRRNARRLGR